MSGAGRKSYGKWEERVKEKGMDEMEYSSESCGQLLARKKRAGLIKLATKAYENTQLQSAKA